MNFVASVFVGRAGQKESESLRSSFGHNPVQIQFFGRNPFKLSPFSFKCLKLMLVFYLPAEKEKDIFKLNRIFRFIKKIVAIFCVSVYVKVFSLRGCFRVCVTLSTSSLCVCLKSGSIYIKWFSDSD